MVAMPPTATTTAAAAIGRVRASVPQVSHSGTLAGPLARSLMCSSPTTVRPAIQAEIAQFCVFPRHSVGMVLDRKPRNFSTADHSVLPAPRDPHNEESADHRSALIHIWQPLTPRHGPL